MSRVKQYDDVYNLDIGKIVVNYDKPANGGETFLGKNKIFSGMKASHQTADLCRQILTLQERTRFIPSALTLTR